MPIDALPLGYVLAPVLFVIGSVYFLAPMLPLQRPWARRAIFILVWLIVGRYLGWRFFTTVLPAPVHGVALAWIWYCFLVELFAIGDALILYITFLRASDRRVEADRLEEQMRASPPNSLPEVDVYIPTYNEPMEVVEKTIIGALSLDYPKVKLWVLDDGRRQWLRDFCQSKGAGYITRPDNAHAKAGNINHALQHTNAEFVAVFDADFVPQRNFLMRTLGFFADPKVGIVQAPHAFYNSDPMQANLSLRKTLPDDQRFFFEAIMPSRDGWGAAFCCGSNSVTRRAAIRSIGDALPLGSITEDMLLSLALLRQGYVTRYLCEHLAFGLAPESLRAFFVQRQRWARGALQMLYLPEGPFGRGLRFIHRILFLPTHWLSGSAMLLTSLIMPLVFLWTGLSPLVNVTTEGVVHYIVPMVLAILGGLMVYAPRYYFPLSGQVLSTFQSFKVLPVAVQTLLRPHGHVFKVTPKGGDAGAAGYDRMVYWVSALLMAMTFAGLLINAFPDWRIVTQTALLPMVFAWSSLNIIVLFLVCMMSVQSPVRRTEERFDVEEPTWVCDANGRQAEARTRDLSLSGAGAVMEPADAARVSAGDRVRIFIREVGFIPGTVARQRENLVGIQFDLPAIVERDLLIRKLFTSGLNTTTITASSWSATAAMLKSIWATHSSKPVALNPEMQPMPMARLPARTLVIAPEAVSVRLADLVPARRELAA